MEKIIDFLLNHLQFISYILIGFGLFLLTTYLISPYFRFPFFRKKDKSWLKSLEPYLDKDGKIVFEKLAKVWVEGSVRNRYTKEDIKYIWEKAIDDAFASYVRKTEAAMAEHVRPLDINDQEYNQNEDPIDLAFKKVPKDEILAVFSDSIFSEPIPGLENLTEEEKEKLKEEVIQYFLQKYKTIGEIDEKEVRAHFEKVAREKMGSSSISLKDIEHMADKEQQELEQEQNQKLLFALDRTRKIVSSMVNNQGYIGSSSGDLPENIKKIFMDIGFSSDIVNKIRIGKTDLLYYESKFDYVYENKFVLLLGFLNVLYKKNILPLFIRERYDIVKVVKDFFLFCLDNYIPEREGKESYYRFIGHARFLFFLKATNNQGYIKYTSEKPHLVKFLPIVMSYIYQEYDSDLLTDFILFLKENVNIKKQDMIRRDLSQFAKDDQPKEISYDMIGFTFDGSIYLLPKALNIYFGEYFLAIPYILNGFLEFFFKPGFDIYAAPHLVMTKTKDKVEEESMILSKIIDDESISGIIYSTLDHKEPRISKFKNIIGVKLQ